MMHPTSERTPLLHRGAATANAKRRDFDAESSIQSSDMGYRDEVKRRPRKRGLASTCTRFTVPLSQLLKSTSSPLFTTPPLNDEVMYEDTHNDDPMRCSCGTREDDGIWMNHSDRIGTIMSVTVWILFLYSGLTVVLLAQSHHCPMFVAAVYCTLCALALASHIKTSLTDPGSVPSSAVPITTNVPFHTMCSVCQTYKPERAHHCRICNRCIARLDHHCPWMNTCIGACNTKHFVLFLIYTWTASALALLLFVCNYFFCSSVNCEFDVVEMQLVRAMSVMCLGALIFTSSMLISVLYAIVTGVGTIDRLKRKAGDTWNLSTDEPIPLTDIFGMAGYWTWWLPIDPVFDDYDRIMGFATLQRLLRQNTAQGKELEV